MVPHQPKRLKPPRGVLTVAAALLVVGVLGFAVPLWRIDRAAAGKDYSDLDEVPPRDVAIVLGARVYDDATPSPFLRERLDLGVQLFRAGTVKVVVVSGANTASSNFETDVMRDYVIAAGVPAGKVVADPKGFDTFDTCIRARQVYGVTSAVMVSQGYHIPRAIRLCTSVGIDAVGLGGYARVDSPYWRDGEIREVFAGPKVELDLLFGGVEDPKDPAVAVALGR